MKAIDFVNKILNETKEENEIRNSKLIKWTSKPDSLDEVKETNFNELPEDLRALINGLKVYKGDEVYAIKHDEMPSISDNFENTPTSESVFCLEMGEDDFYLVNTEGYSYCRYITKLSYGYQK